MSRDGWRKKASEGDGWGGMGGYMAAKVSKLEKQFMRDAPREKEKHGASSTIFSGVAIHVNGYTEPSADELRRLMMLHGGQFHVYYSHTKTTHIIATNLPNFKIKELRAEKVVRPEWITDSIKAGRQLSYLHYQLYAKQKGLIFTSVRPQQVQEQTGVGQEPSSQFNLNLSQPGNFHDSTNPTLTVVQSEPPKPAEKTSHQLINRLNGSHVGIFKKDASKLNGVHDGYSCKLSKGHLQKNGYVYPLNGALKQEENISCLESTHQGEFRCPQPKAEETGTSSCLSSNILASDLTSATVSTSLQASPSGATHHKRIHGSSMFSMQTASGIGALHEKPVDSERSLDQEQISRVRLNGSHYNTSDVSLPAKQSAQGPETGIISEFFSHSRLHHISTWRSEFSEYVNTLQSKRRAAGSTVFSGKEKLKKLRVDHCAGTSFIPAPHVYPSCILHVDMDCFFASVGIRHRPELRGKPVAVTSNRGRGLVAQRPGANPQLEFQYYHRKQNQHRTGKTGDDIELTPSLEAEETDSNKVEHDHATLSMAEIASCSYEARQAGVRNGMFFGQAKQLCPELQSVPYDFHAYKEVALAMYETLASYTHNIEALSCDEALVDATSLLKELGITPDELAAAIRSDVREKTGCCASVGMSSNILLARMATRKAKPNGQYFLRPEEVDDFIRDQPVTSLPGVGRSMSNKLASFSVTTCGALQQLSIVRLQKEFGPRTGQTLFRFCRGLDDRPVRSEKERKSVSAEMNYNIRFTNEMEAETFLTNLSLEVQKRLQGAGLRGRRVTLKVMMRKAGAPVEPAKYGGHGICDNLARSVLLPHPTDCGQLIAAEVIKLLRAMKLAVIDMRGVGLQVHLLESTHSDAGPSRSRNIKELLTSRRPMLNHSKDVPKKDDLCRSSSIQKGISSPSTTSCTFSDSIPGTSKGDTPVTDPRAILNLSIEVPPPSQVDHSVLDALPPELREQVEQAWKNKQVPDTSFHPATTEQSFTAAPSVLLHLPDQHGQAGSTGIILELPDFSQVDPDVFAALPRELQEELRSAYRSRENAQAQEAEQKNPLLHPKQTAMGKTKRCYKRKHASPAKKCASPLKRLIPGISPAKSSPSKTIPLLLKEREALSGFKMENGPASSSVSHQALSLPYPEVLPKGTHRPVPTLAGAFELNDVRALLREWVTTISEPMEEDILQVVKYCTELVEDKDLEKLDLVIKYMKRLMQQSVESVWSMAFDFILDNVQVVVQQTYGSTLKIT